MGILDSNVEYLVVAGGGGGGDGLGATGQGGGGAGGLLYYGENISNAIVTGKQIGRAHV